MDPYPQTSATVVFDDSEGPLDPILLGSFLKNFAVLHNAITSVIDEDDDIKADLLDYDPENGQSLIETVILGSPVRRKLIARQYFVEHGSWVKHKKIPDGERWLQISAIQKNSPLMLMMLCIPPALTAAVIFSGGSVKMTLTSFDAKLAPFGVGLQAIRQAVRGGNTSLKHEAQKQIAPKEDD